MPRKMMVTSSLPYANGDIHLGHLVEYMQTDIWARFQRMRGHQCLYICGTDAHGAPVMLRAQKEGIEPEVLVEQMREKQLADFVSFNIQFDNFHTTHSEENRVLTEMIYQRLKDNGDIQRKIIKQAFDPVKEMFLPDRFVKGECPKCGAEDQYGDNCESCSATYAPLEMKNPVSVLTGETPVERESEHLLFDLPKYKTFLQAWMQAGHLQESTTNKLNEWFESGLQCWDISRDKPYFGFAIPDEKDKYFYVWLDAPIGYLASFKQYCDNNQVDFNEYWRVDSKTELYHFIGKDVVYFHSLFWPAVLKAAEIRLPDAVYVHGFLTVEGKKMSKSRGTFIKAETYAKHLNPEQLRYYFAAKLSSSVEDIDLSFDDFKARVNSDLVGKVVNIASRCAGFISKKFDGQLSENLQHELFDQFVAKSDGIAELYEKREFAHAMREIMSLADHANQYINDQQPWVLAKKPETLDQVQAICSLGINLFRVLMIYLTPVLPELSKSVAEFLNVDEFSWTDVESPLLNHRINIFKPLMTRVEEEQIEKMLEESKQDLQETAVEKNQYLAETPIRDEMTIDDFVKVDLRVAKILEARDVEDSKKLLCLKVDIGGEVRQIFAGMKEYYKPEDVVGKLTIVVANLKPRKMRFGLSEGMVAMASSKTGRPYLLEPESGAEPGMIVS